MVLGISNSMYNSPQQMNQGYEAQKRLGSVQQGLKDKYGCEDCFEQGPYFVHYPIPVQQVPRSAVRPSFWSRIVNTFLGGT